MVEPCAAPPKPLVWKPSISAPSGNCGKGSGGHDYKSELKLAGSPLASMTSTGALFRGAELIGSSNAVRFALSCGEGDFRRDFRRIGLAVSGQTIPGLIEAVRMATPTSTSCIVFIGVNDLLAYTRAIFTGAATITSSQNKLRKTTRDLLLELLKTYPCGVTFVETASCPGLSPTDSEWHRVFGLLRYAIKRTVRSITNKHPAVAMCEVDRLLNIHC